ncbi:MAG: sel1 repeat family protein [Myxococcales bacterium]|nr:sel1 repeat family protein [Myxococcales bacterium]
MDGRSVDTEAKIAELQALLPGSDAAALYEASRRGALAIEFRGVDEVLGLLKNRSSQLAQLGELTLQALTRAAELGHLQAGVDLASRSYFSQQTERASEAFALAERATSIPRALYLLGLFYFAGFGCEKDAAKSLHYHQLAAEAGDADALFELYIFHTKGVATAVDKALALSFCERAAEAGSHRAMANLGGFYATGDGVAQDSSKAVFWYDRAVQAGSGRAAATLGLMYAIGDGAPHSDESARRYFRIAESLHYDWRALADQCGLPTDPYEA